MHFIVATLIWFTCWTAAFDIPHEDLNKIKKQCPLSSCLAPDSRNTAPAPLDNTHRRPKCHCDDQCAEYGDCCVDSPHFELSKQLGNASRYKCVKCENGGGSYTTTRCSATWPYDKVRKRCETISLTKANGMLGAPVTSRITGRSYRNRYCAECNNDADDPVVWSVVLTCKDLLNVTEDAKQAVVETLQYGGPTREQWYVTYENNKYWCDCPNVQPPGVRVCIPDVVVGCDAEWPNDVIRSSCDAYTTVVYHGDIPYKNIHCAMCNHVPVKDVTCEKVEKIDFPNHYQGRIFTALLDSKTGHRKCRACDTFYDAFFKCCRPRVTVGRGIKLKCPGVTIYSTLTLEGKLSEVDVHVTIDNGTVIKCKDRVTKTKCESAKSIVLTNVGLGVSTVFLILHLAVFAALPELKNLPGKNLASLCVSLVCSYSAFLAGNGLEGFACYAGAAFTYYSFLTVFAWMLIMSYDCWRSLQLATLELCVKTGRQTRKFLVYSAVCWLVPAVMTLAAVIVDNIPSAENVLSRDLRPKFGANQCWFNNNVALVVFFAGPLTAVMTANLVMFVWSAYMVHTTHSTTKQISTIVRHNFFIYCRLAVLMGLTWITGIIAKLTDKEYIWTLFVLLNAFQGLFVFVAFTCRWHVLKLLFGGDKECKDHCADDADMGASTGDSFKGAHHGNQSDSENNNNKTHKHPKLYTQTSTDNSTISGSSDNTFELSD